MCSQSIAASNIAWLLAIWTCGACSKSKWKTMPLHFWSSYHCVSYRAQNSIQISSFMPRIVPWLCIAMYPDEMFAVCLGTLAANVSIIAEFGISLSREKIGRRCLWNYRMYLYRTNGQRHDGEQIRVHISSSKHRWFGTTKIICKDTEQYLLSLQALANRSLTQRATNKETAKRMRT